MSVYGNGEGEELLHNNNEDRQRGFTTVRLVAYLRLLMPSKTAMKRQLQTRR